MSGELRLRVIIQNKWPVLIKSVMKILKDKECRAIRTQEAEDTQQLKAVGLRLGPEKGTGVRRESPEI